MRKQRILIHNPPLPERTQRLTYENMCFHGGFGGTEVAFMEIGKYLCEQAGFDVVVVGVSSDTYKDTSSGIQFVSQDDFDLQSVNAFDWYCPLFHVYDRFHYELLSHIRDKSKTKVMLWFHCFIPDNIVIAHKEQGFDLYGVGVSEWVRSHYTHLFDNAHLWVTPNAVSTRFHDNCIVPQKTQGKWCFHATFNRGASVAIRVFEKISKVAPGAAKEFNMMSYYTPDAKHVTPPFVIRHGSLSKTKVAEILKYSEYFVYPLATPENDVHHDTYGCVIMEALAMGVIVVTWNVACIPQLYSDYVVGLDPPAGYPRHQRFVRDPWFSSDEAVNRLTQAVLELEMNPHKKQAIRERGIAWSRQHTWEKSGDIMHKELLARCSSS